MNMKKSLLALVAVGAMGFGAASATGIGLVDINAALSAHPQAGVAQMQANKIRSEYGTKIQAEIKKIEKMQDKKAQEEAYKKNVLPLEQKGSEEINKVISPLIDTVVKKVEEVRMQKKLDLVITDPTTVVTIDKNYPNEDITAAVVEKVKMAK